MTKRAKFNLVFLILSIILLILNSIIFYQENEINWFRLISNLMIILVFSLNLYNESKKQQ